MLMLTELHNRGCLIPNVSSLHCWAAAVAAKPSEASSGSNAALLCRLQGYQSPISQTQQLPTALAAALPLTCDGPAECHTQPLSAAKVADAALPLLLAEHVSVAGMVVLQGVVVEQVAPCRLGCILTTCSTSVLQAAAAHMHGACCCCANLHALPL
jgi:hypothetical protein